MQGSRIQAVEINFLRKSCGGRTDGESNKSVYNKFGLFSGGEGKECGVNERVKCNTSRWFGQIDRMPGSKKTMYMSKVRPLGVQEEYLL